jgi:hypothetical protein
MAGSDDRNRLDQLAEFIEQICPGLHQLYALGPIFGAVVGAADLILVLMREHGLDNIRIEAAAVQDGAAR